MDAAIPVPEFMAWAEKVIRHTGNVLTAKDFEDWREWVEEMTALQHPKLL